MLVKGQSFRTKSKTVSNIAPKTITFQVLFLLNNGNKIPTFLYLYRIYYHYTYNTINKKYIQTPTIEYRGKIYNERQLIIQPKILTIQYIITIFLQFFPSFLLSLLAAETCCGLRWARLSGLASFASLSTLRWARSRSRIRSSSCSTRSFLLVQKLA